MDRTNTRTNLPEHIVIALEFIDSVMAMTTLADIDTIKQARDAMQTFEDFGWVTDPTLYRAGFNNRQNDLAVLNAFIEFRANLDAVKERMEQAPQR